jgi:hypothetical protein
VEIKIIINDEEECQNYFTATISEQSTVNTSIVEDAAVFEGQ